MRIRFAGLALTGAVLATAVAGCGSGSPHPATTLTSSVSGVVSPTAAVPPPAPSQLPPYAGLRHHACAPAAATAIAATAGVRTASLATRRTRANTGAAECVFTGRAGGHLVVSVAVSGASQPYAVMERGAEEEGQYWGGRRLQPAPQPVFHLGIGAFWFPAEQHLETTDAVNLITVTVVRWPGATQRRRRALAAAAARPYLGPLRPKLARGPSPT
jgi:hypothetical protein